jgi:thiamine kinase-like enzyme
LNRQLPIDFENIGSLMPSRVLDRIATAVGACEAKLGEQFSSAKDITSIPNADRAVLLIQFASGLKLKLRIFAQDNYYFEQNNRLIEALGSANFPRVLCSGEGWVAFEWIPGRTVSQQACSQEIVREAARLLTAIHNAAIEPGAGTAETILKEVRLKLDEKLPVLVSNNIVSVSQSQRVSNLCNSLSAGGLNISLIHGDFSPANLVVHGKDLFAVDNEKMRLHVTDYDVCRAVTFWDEWNLSGCRLLDAYLEASRRTFAVDSLFFWGIFDLVYRISYRLASLSELNEFCVTRLRQILRTGAFR